MDYLVVGLGNPGRKYQNTRHNVGFLAIEELQQRHESIEPPGRTRKKSRQAKPQILKGQASVSHHLIDNKNVVLACPQTFMNLSGKALKLLVKKYRIANLSQLIVIQDELDLAPGKVKVKLGGGSSGHKGIESITTILRNKEFWRVRVGIGKPESSGQGADYVLGNIEEKETWEGVKEAANLVEGLIAEQS